ncbi:MAG: hypothetical protein ACLFTY_00155 [Candidatus Aenigmatarchaeota archaeon]
MFEESDKEVYVAVNNDVSTMRNEEIEGRSIYPSTRLLLSSLDSKYDVSVIKSEDYLEGENVGKIYELVNKGRDSYLVEKDERKSKVTGDLLFIRGTEHKSFSTREEFDKIIDHLDEYSENFEYVINDLSAEWLAERKDKYEELDDVPTLKNYDVSGPGEFEDLLEEKGKIIKKPIIGGQGLDVQLLENDMGMDDIEEMFGDENIDEYLFQEFIPGRRDRRIVFINDNYLGKGFEIIGSREIRNRDTPWGPENEVVEKERLRYKPSKREEEITRSIAEQTGMTYGCADFVVLPQELRKQETMESKIMEINGACTGLKTRRKVSGERGEREFIYQLAMPVNEYVDELLED